MGKPSKRAQPAPADDHLLIEPSLIALRKAMAQHAALEEQAVPLNLQVDTTPLERSSSAVQLSGLGRSPNDCGCASGSCSKGCSVVTGAGGGMCSSLPISLLSPLLPSPPQLPGVVAAAAELQRILPACRQLWAAAGGGGAPLWRRLRAAAGCCALHGQRGAGPRQRGRAAAGGLLPAGEPRPPLSRPDPKGPRLLTNTTGPAGVGVDR